MKMKAQAEGVKEKLKKRESPFKGLNKFFYNLTLYIDIVMDDYDFFSLFFLFLTFFSANYKRNNYKLVYMKKLAYIFFFPCKEN